MADRTLLTLLLNLSLRGLMLSLSLLGLLSRLVGLMLSLRLGILQHLLVDHLILNGILTLLRTVWHRLTRLSGHWHAIGRKHRFSLILLQLLSILDSQTALKRIVSLDYSPQRRRLYQCEGK